MLLIECLVYIAVFAILLGGGFTVFYFCWDHSKALLTATGDIESALRAGEGWRADVRAATGTPSVSTSPAGEVLRIPQKAGEIVYRCESGLLTRDNGLGHSPRILLRHVKSSQITADPRGPASVWRWELELTQRRTMTQLPLRFTFEAVQPKP